MPYHLAIRRHIWISWLLAFVLVLVACSRTESDIPYLKRRANFKTKLIKEGPLPGGNSPVIYPRDWPLLERIEEVTYPSGNLNLNAWVYVPEDTQGKQYPALVYFHGGLEVHEGTIRDCKPFIEAGFVVMAPMFRGEKDNPGYHELFMGEVDDAKAAICWLAEQPYVDRNQIYAFGWSYGGAISTLLSLMDNVPVKHSGSSGGLYNAGIIDGWGEEVPFDRTNPKEMQMRLLIGNIRWMQHKHYAYMGSADNWFSMSITLAKQEMDKRKSLLEIIMLPGDHMSSFPKAIEMYLDLIRQENAAGLRVDERVKKK